MSDAPKRIKMSLRYTNIGGERSYVVPAEEGDEVLEYILRTEAWPSDLSDRIKASAAQEKLSADEVIDWAIQAHKLMRDIVSHIEGAGE